jgi:hypothetical protein
MFRAFFSAHHQEFNPDCLETVIRSLHETYQCQIYSRKLMMMGTEECPKHVQFYNNKIGIISASGWLFTKKPITMRGNMNVKFKNNLKITRAWGQPIGSSVK